MKLSKVESLLGLAMKSGNVVGGGYAVEEAIKNGKALLVVIAADSSDGTKKHLKDKCSFYQVPFVEYGTRETLGRAIGKEMRASLAISDFNFAKAVCGQIDQTRKQMEGAE
ncbi:MAG: ribosomal L7Ae/L30e/S12e/Gadd45 family protein [Lachnospiraceae bacterium]|nr:ribosomal L7Ae/L30e/S12e/Gadd45 family protein [Lachnospiraceae bacterium]